jgi:protein-S-isoprenylcysteine O-methyltransferase Ste14
MWEEHPAYQKRQALAIGVLLLVLLVVCVANAIIARDWDSLKQILLFAAGFVIALGLLVGFAWALVKIFTRKHAGGSKIEDNHDV